MLILSLPNNKFRTLGSVYTTSSPPPRSTPGQTDRRTDGGALQYLPSRAFGAAGDNNVRKQEHFDCDNNYCSILERPLMSFSNNPASSLIDLLEINKLLITQSLESENLSSDRSKWNPKPIFWGLTNVFDKNILSWKLFLGQYDKKVIQNKKKSKYTKCLRKFPILGGHGGP